MKKFWNKLKISKKLIITFLLVAILSGSSGLISLSLLKKADTQYSDALINYGFSQGDIGLLMSSLRENTANIIMTMATDDPALLQKNQESIKANTALINQYMKNVEQTLSNDQERKYYNIISENLPEFSEHAREVIALAVENQDAEAMALYQSEALEHIEKIEEATD